MTIIVGIDPASTTGAAVHSTLTGEWLAEQFDWRYAPSWVDNTVAALWQQDEDIVVGMELPFVGDNAHAAIQQGAIYGWVWGTLHHLFPSPATWYHLTPSQWRSLISTPNSKRISKQRCVSIADSLGCPPRFGPRGGAQDDYAEAVGIALAAGRRYYDKRYTGSRDKILVERL